jgi:putative flippase GtrA
VGSSTPSIEELYCIGFNTILSEKVTHAATMRSILAPINPIIVGLEAFIVLYFIQHSILAYAENYKYLLLTSMPTSSCYYYVMQSLSQFTRHFGLYQTINICAFLFDLALLSGLNYLMPTSIAVGASFLISSSFSYLLNHRITFRESERELISGYWYFLFFAILRGILLTVSTAGLMSSFALTLLLARTLAGTLVGTLGFFGDYLITFKMHQRHGTRSQ